MHIYVKFHIFINIRRQIKQWKMIFVTNIHKKGFVSVIKNSDLKTGIFLVQPSMTLLFKMPLLSQTVCFFLSSVLFFSQPSPCILLSDILVSISFQWNLRSFRADI